MNVEIRGKSGELGVYLISFLMFLMFLPSVFSVTGFTNQQSMYFTGDSSSPGFLYQDMVGSGNNVDVGIELCGQGSKFVGGFYALYDGSTWHNSLVTYSGSNALAETTNNLGSGCYSVPPGFVTISPSTFTTPDPDVFKAALPGRLWIGYADSANPGSISDFEHAGSTAEFKGYYTVTRSFDQGSRMISLQTPRIYFTPTGSSFSKLANDGNYGVNADRQMVIGICDDPDGLTCVAGTKLTTAAFPQVFTSGLGLGDVNDQQTHTKYAVINGLSYPMCIGANLQSSVINVTPDPIYYSQNLIINYVITNPRDTLYELDGGNVEVTASFQVGLTIYNASDSNDIIYSTSFLVSEDIPPDGSYDGSFSWPAYDHSGVYTVEIEVDSGGVISECDEGDNTDTENFELKPITIAEILVDSVDKTGQTNIFDIANVPYNVTFHLENSDGDILNNATLVMVETSGLSLTSPTQIFNISTNATATEKSGVITETRSSFTTDYYGNSSFAYIPTYNKFYLPQYNYTDLDEYIGNYSLSFTGSQSDGIQFIFIFGGGDPETNYPLGIVNTSYTGSYSHKVIINEAMVSQSLDFIYHAFANFLDTII